MSRSSGSTVRESVYALSLVAVESEGRKAILAHSGSIQLLLQQLDSSDVAAVRYSALALGNLAMDADGRKAILQASRRKHMMQRFLIAINIPVFFQIPQVSSQLTKLLTSSDFETARYASLSVVRCEQRRTQYAAAAVLCANVPQGNLVLEQSGRGQWRALQPAPFPA
jgi:hypothetical protein